MTLLLLACLHLGSAKLNSAPPLINGDCPAHYPIKANYESILYHMEGGDWYDSVDAEVCFETAEDAESDGYEPCCDILF